MIDLDCHPGVEINNEGLRGRVNRKGEPLTFIAGFLPFQVRAVNYALKVAQRSVFFNMDTGLGKTPIAEGVIVSFLRDRSYDLCLYVVRKKRIDTKEAYHSLLQHTGIEGVVVDGSPQKRRDLWALPGPVFILTAEKFKEDKETLKRLVEGRRVLVVFDEMPIKYSNRSSQLYRATAEVLYTSFTQHRQRKIYYPKWGADRPSEVFYVALCADLMVNSPEDTFNCIRMMDPSIFGSVAEFERRYIASRDHWGNVRTWRDLDHFSAQLQRVVYSKSKDDPDVVDQFPEKKPSQLVACPLDPNSAFLYNQLLDEYWKLSSNQKSALTRAELLAAISVLQMVCSNPRAVLKSGNDHARYLMRREQFLKTGPARKEIIEWDKKNRKGSEVALKLLDLVDDDARFTDRSKSGQCVITKMLRLREWIDAHPEKCIVFTSVNETTIPYMAEWFDEWRISYVTFHGQMTSSQGQVAYMGFREDPNIKVFLANDAGSDSINLPEASLTIHYDHPYTNLKFNQRNNRQHRIDSLKESVQEVSLYCPGTVEERRLEIIEQKSKLQEQIKTGVTNDEPAPSGRQALLRVLFGDD